MTPKLDAAAKRLQAALTRIEGAIAACLSTDLPEGEEGARQLATQLASARAENQELAAANVSVAARLDNAIDRLRAVLRN